MCRGDPAEVRLVFDNPCEVANLIREALTELDQRTADVHRLRTYTATERQPGD